MQATHRRDRCAVTHSFRWWRRQAYVLINQVCAVRSAQLPVEAEQLVDCQPVGGCSCCACVTGADFGLVCAEGELVRGTHQVPLFEDTAVDF